MTGVRELFAAQLRDDWQAIPLLAPARVLATERPLDAVTELTALVRAKKVVKPPTARQSHRQHHLLLTVVSPHEDVDLAADQLDDLTDVVLGYLDTRFLHDGAELVGYGSDRLAVDIALSVIHPK